MFCVSNTEGAITMTDVKNIEIYNSKIKRILITEEEIKEAIAKASKVINDSYDGRPILLVSILKGAFVFMADFCRAITVPCEIGFMCAKSYYSGTVSTGAVKITMDLDQDISKYHVVIVEDIIDSGLTIKELLASLEKHQPAEIRIASLLVKPNNLKVELDIPYCCFKIPNDFIVGYGLDYDGEGRNLKDIYTVIE
jgi:hypoxanthine phosphoribosyltransferase